MAEHVQSTGLARQFEKADQQRETGALAIWVFLAAEIMFFGGLVAAYVIYRHFYFSAFEQGSRTLSMLWGVLGTVVVLTSGLTMALSVRAARMGERGALTTSLFLTLLLGLGFVGITGMEYHRAFVERVVPGMHFSPVGSGLAQMGAAALGHAQLYFMFYFAMTGLLAIQMIAGLVVLLILLFLASREKFTAQYFVPVEVAGVYWQFLTIVWIFVFPLLYLVGGR